jgi:hypothetical protein
VKVLCIGNINVSNDTFKKVLKAGLSVEWGTAETVEEAREVEQFYDYIVVRCGIKYSSPKCISFQKLIFSKITCNITNESICF